MGRGGGHTRKGGVGASAPHALVHRRNLTQGQEISQAVARDHPHQPSGVADERVVQPQQSESYVHLGQLGRMRHLFSFLWGKHGSEVKTRRTFYTRKRGELKLCIVVIPPEDNTKTKTKTKLELNSPGRRGRARRVTLLNHSTAAKIDKYCLGSMRPPAAISRRLSPSATTPALIRP